MEKLTNETLDHLYKELTIKQIQNYVNNVTMQTEWKDKRPQKIRDLKKAIEDHKQETINIIKTFKPEEITDKTEGEISKLRAEHQTQMEVRKVELENLKQELNLVRQNKNSSKFFEFIPTPPNRKMRKLIKMYGKG
jgi:hypothetical protein